MGKPIQSLVWFRNDQVKSAWYINALAARIREVLMSQKEIAAVNKKRYIENVTAQSGYDITANRFCLASAQELLIACDVILACTENQITERWPRLKEHRDVLAKFLIPHLPSEWKDYGEWKVLIQNALENVRQQRLMNQRFEFDEWASWEEQETDIHISVQCSRQTIAMFCYDNPHVLHKTSIFAVPQKWNEFVASLISGEIRPANVDLVDSTKAPACLNGVHPRYVLP